ncbi:hypothetical protein VFPBJ_05395 [Purpureocillium lilacinum]|uniref:Uncharacterized protein n=1 Tax=Purpureocillium lilacinum TaxID=33203 RepID=A0A179GR39_PURLI|nr:hypothetical protein VFPBJ_05395 [Purpureocillium lilacinum]
MIETGSNNVLDWKSHDGLGVWNRPISMIVSSISRHISSAYEGGAWCRHLMSGRVWPGGENVNSTHVPGRVATRISNGNHLWTVWGLADSLIRPQPLSLPGSHDNPSRQRRHLSCSQ